MIKDLFKEYDELLREIREDPERVLGEKLHKELSQMTLEAVREARNYLINLVEAGENAYKVEPPKDGLAMVVLKACGYLDIARTPTGSYSHVPSERGHLAYSKWMENPSLPFLID